METVVGENGPSGGYATHCIGLCHHLHQEALLTITLLFAQKAGKGDFHSASLISLVLIIDCI